MKRNRYITIGLALFLGATALNARGKSKIDNPKDIGHRKVAGWSLISMKREIAIGRKYAAQIDSSSKILKDPVITEYVNRIEQNIAENSDVRVPVSVKIIEDPTVNAMTLPGGFIYVDTGLLKALSSEDELAGVLAHETGHVAARSWASTQTKREILQYAMIPLMFTPMSAALYYGVEESYMNGIPMAFLKFSRDQEKKADFLGIQYMWKAGYDPNGLVEAFGKIMQESRKNPGSVASIFMDHPPTGTRIIAAEKEIKNLLPKRKHYLVNTSGYIQMRQRLAMLMGQQNELAKNEDKNSPTLEKREPGAKVPPGSETSDKPPVLERRN